MKSSLRIAIACLLLAGPGLAGVVEDFEHGNPLLYTQASGSLDNLKITPAAAHDGGLGAQFVGSGGPFWYYRGDVSTSAGNSYFCYVRLGGSGRIYVGVNSTLSGCYSIVAAPNTSELIIQDNGGWGYNDLTSASVNWDTTGTVWYRMELQWDTNGDMTARLWDEFGVTKIAETATVSTGQTGSGGIAIRGFGSSSTFQDLDTITTGESLVGSPSSISASTGGAQALTLDVGAAFAGNVYVIAGSLSGTVPGIPFQGEVIPLNFDAYTNMTVTGGGGVLIGGFGALNVLGQAVANFLLPPVPALAGVRVNHAAVVIDPGGALLVVTNAAPCDLTP
jgi:hypothetical protein